MIDGLSNPDTAATVPARSPRTLSDPIQCLMVGSDYSSSLANSYAAQRIRDALFLQSSRLGEQRRGMDEDVSGKQGGYPRQKSRRAELRKGVLAPIRRHHVVAGLRAAVKSYDRSRLAVAGQAIDKQSFAGVAKT